MRHLRAAAVVLLLGAISVPAAARATSSATSSTATSTSTATFVPRFTHVVEVFLENESATATFEDAKAAPHLTALKKLGVYVPNFFGAGHASLDNYEAAFGGVQPTPQGEADCAGQPYGSCIFPAGVPTLGALLDAKHLPWRVYSEGMTGAPGGHNCLHAVDRSAPDFYQGPGTNGYATRHNPAPWFASVLDKGGNEKYCRAHSVDLTQFWTDTSSTKTFPAWSFIEPDTCHDGHDTQSLGGCTADPEGPAYPSGIGAIDKWTPTFVQRLLHTKGWDSHSLLVITFDEGAATDTAGCKPCHDTSAGGRIGALFISGQVAHPGTVSKWQGDHYSLLRTWETAWGLPTLKSHAKSKAAAKTVHDGDPGVTALTGIWK